MWTCGIVDSVGWLQLLVICSVIQQPIVQLNPLFDPICIFARFMPEKAALLADRVLTELVKVCASHGTIISTWLGPLLVWNVNWVITDLIFEIPGTQG